MNVKLVLSFVFGLCVPTMAYDRGLITATRLLTSVSAQRGSAHPNFVLSPFSILGVFHMAQLGAESETRAEMDALVGPDEDFKLPPFGSRRGDDGKDVVVETANRIYASRSMEGNVYFQKFNKEVGVAVGGDAKTIDFSNGQEAAQVMNKFVEEKTKGHIKDLIDPSTISAATRVVLMNALYFKAPWRSPFSEAETGEGVFYGETAEGPKELRVKYMRQSLEEGFAVIQESEMTAFSMNYVDLRLSMYVFMPADMQAFESKIAAEPEALEALAARVKSAARPESMMILQFPKFKLDASANNVDLVDLFRRMGAKRMFDPAEADFSGMTGNRELSVSSYIHQADIVVDEQGTEATAATAMGIALTSMPVFNTIVKVTVDRPFLFQVRFEDEGRSPAILFAGRVSDPLAAQ